MTTNNPGLYNIQWNGSYQVSDNSGSSTVTDALGSFVMGPGSFEFASATSIAGLANFTPGIPINFGTISLDSLPPIDVSPKDVIIDGAMED